MENGSGKKVAHPGTRGYILKYDGGNQAGAETLAGKFKAYLSVCSS